MRMDPLFEIRTELDRCSSGGVAVVLASQLRKAIADGRLPGGSKLPATRKAQAAFGISRNTLADVYERLVAEGHLISRHGSGIYVADTRLLRRLCAPPEKRARTSGFELNPFWKQPEAATEIGFWTGPNDDGSTPIEVDFRPGLVDSQLFPYDIYRRITAKQLRGLEINPLRVQRPQRDRDSYPLRTAIAVHVAVTRGVACDPDQVLVTTGAQQAFDLLARLLVTPGSTRVAVEDPGYPPMRVPFRAAGAAIAPVGVDKEGLKVAEIPEGTKIICVRPSHQYPLGVTMSPRRRAALHAFARKNGAIIIEDDYDGEFRFDNAPVDTLWNIDTSDHVFYVGTFSKSILPAFRLGFIIVPDWALDTITLIKNGADGPRSRPVERGVASFIAEGHLMRHVRKMRTIYRKRRDVIVEHLERFLAQWLDPLKCSCGMHLAALSTTDINMERVTQMVRDEGVAIHTLDRYFLAERTLSGLVFGFGVTTETDIESGLRMLRRALESNLR
jgi:GntR family transcriptional regulator/MocR family aminotransferase